MNVFSFIKYVDFLRLFLLAISGVIISRLPFSFVMIYSSSASWLTHFIMGYQSGTASFPVTCSFLSL